MAEIFLFLAAGLANEARASPHEQSEEWLLDVEEGRDVDIHLIDRLRSHSNTTVKGAASERQIAAAEKKLGVRFPPSYRAFLAAFDGGEFCFARMYRLTTKGAGFFNLARELARVAEFYKPFEERSLFPFGDDYGGNLFCFDFTGQAEEAPVVLVGRLLLEDNAPKRQASNLTKFIEKGLSRTKRCT